MSKEIHDKQWAELKTDSDRVAWLEKEKNAYPYHIHGQAYRDKHKENDDAALCIALEEALRTTANETENTVLSDALNALIDKCVAIRESNQIASENQVNTQQTFWNPNALEPKRALNGLLTAAMIRTYLLSKRAINKTL